MISRDGQERVLQQALELTPWSKLLWSTDGHYYPETFWLANVQGREAMEKVLCNYVESGDLNIDDAVRTARDIFFENSNRLYSLKLQFDARNLPDRSKNAKPTVEEVSRIFNFCQNHIS
jgi:hypothetical protein